MHVISGLLAEIVYALSFMQAQVIVRRKCPTNTF